MFIFEAEYEIFTNTKNWVSNFTHPIILAGFVAQLLLLYGALFQKAHRKLITLGILLLGLVVLLFLIVGILGLNAKIILAALPYLCLSGYYFYARKRL